MEHTCEFCKYKEYPMESEQCTNCTQNATDKFKPWEICKWYKMYSKTLDKMIYNTSCGCTFDILYESEKMRYCPYCRDLIKVEE